MRPAGGHSTVAMITAALNLCFFAPPLMAADCSVQTTDFQTQPGNDFNVTMSGFTSADIQTAANYWSCPGYSGEIPGFQIGGSGGIPVLVVKNVGRSNAVDGGCGEGVLHVVNGSIESARIDIWTQQADGVSCAPLTDVIAHEFGHLLGEEHAQDPFGACFGHIMGGTVEGQTRSVYGDDCAVADAMWETTWESQPPDDPYCNAYCWTTCIGSLCPNGNPWCPILVDMENDGIHLTGLGDPVLFDIDADGDADLISWTDRSEGLLALDRNSDGTLAELDSLGAGGNQDGVITETDAAFSSLLMWTDLNHDGISQPEELQTLPEAGIVRMDLDYKSSRRTDRYGNEFRFLGRAWKENRRGIAHPVLTWDVFFVVAP
jgi:hypothetical protein